MTQRLVVNNPTGQLRRSMGTAIRCDTRSCFCSLGWKSGSAAGAMPSGMPPPRMKVWKWPCSPGRSFLSWAW